MAENNDGKYILEDFILSGLHPIHDRFAEWPKGKTVIVCLIEYSPDTKKSNDIVTKWNIPESDGNDSVHAELVLIDHIEKEEDPTKIKRITIYINYSPCTDCGKELKEMKKRFPDMQIKVIFSALYKQLRPSCKFKRCQCKKGDLEAITILNELGAWSIKKEDWDCLIKLLENKGHSLSVLNGLRFGDQYGGWRNGEDKQLTEDYKEMSEEMSKNTPSTPNEKTSGTGEPPHPSKGDQTTGRTGGGKSRRKLDYPSKQ